MAQADKTLQKATNLGVDFFSKVLDGAQELLDEAQSILKKSSKGGKKSPDALVKSAKKIWSRQTGDIRKGIQDLRSDIREEIGTVLGRVGIVTASDLEKVEKRIEKLESKLSRRAGASH